jgi:hypothetical protein
MGLGDLIYKKPKVYEAPKTKTEQYTENTNETKKLNWWFLD